MWFELLQDFPHEIVHVHCLVICGDLFMRVSLEISGRREEGNLRESLAIRRRASGDALVQFLCPSSEWLHRGFVMCRGSLFRGLVLDRAFRRRCEEGLRGSDIARAFAILPRFRRFVIDEQWFGHHVYGGRFHKGRILESYRRGSMLRFSFEIVIGLEGSADDFRLEGVTRFTGWRRGSEPRIRSWARRRFVGEKRLIVSLDYSGRMSAIGDRLRTRFDDRFGAYGAYLTGCFRGDFGRS